MLRTPFVITMLLSPVRTINYLPILLADFHEVSAIIINIVYRCAFDSSFLFYRFPHNLIKKLGINNWHNIYFALYGYKMIVQICTFEKLQILRP